MMLVGCANCDSFHDRNTGTPYCEDCVELPEIKRLIRRSEMFGEVGKECERQDKKWGPQSHFNHVWLSIAAEELGEIAKDTNERNLSNLDFEIMQLAAVCLNWLTDKKREDDIDGNA